jgi:hypothetical protein
MDTEEHLYIPEEIEHNAMLQTFESKKGADEEIPEQIVVHNDKENLIPVEESKKSGAILVGPINSALTNAMQSKLSLLKKKIESNNNITNRLPKSSATSSAYVTA